MTAPPRRAATGTEAVEQAPQRYPAIQTFHGFPVWGVLAVARLIVTSAALANRCRRCQHLDHANVAAGI